MRVCLSMDGEGFGSDALRSSNWEVYRDSFAPPAPSRRVRPWERAPVPAHAPRLQGQKVWKKVGVKAHFKEDDKENCEAAQEELERGGMGARKKARVRGGKENISNALWKTGMVDGEEFAGMASPKKQRMSMGPGDMDAFVVPRKRTNANHLITPRKPRRKIPLMKQTPATITAPSPPKTLVQSLQGPVKFSPQKISLNDQETHYDGTKSPVKPSPQKIPLNDLDLNEDEIVPPAEKPVRRRKSLRRSTRRLTRGTTPEQPPAAPAEDILANPAFESAASVVEVLQKESEALGNVTALTKSHGLTTAEAPGEIIAPTAVQEPASLEDAEVSISKSQHEVEISVTGPPVTPKAMTDVLNEDPLAQQQELIPVHTFATSQADLPNNTVEPATIIEEPSIAAANKTPTPQPPMLNSIEVGTETRFTSPTKGSGTPRQRRKTPQRRGSRRSARSTRANSVPPEDRPAQDAPEIQDSNPTSSPIKSRMAKTPTRKGRKSTGQDSVVMEQYLPTETDRSQDTETTTPASKPNPKIGTQVQQMEFTDAESIVTTQSSNSISHSEHVHDLEPAIQSILPSAEAGGEDPNLAISTTVEEAFGAGVVNIIEDIIFNVCGTAAAVTTGDEHISSPLKFSQSEELVRDELKEGSVETIEVFEPTSISTSTEKLLEDPIEEPADELPESSTPNPSTTELVETISENAPANTFDHDDTDMLRNFLTRVKANKAAKAGTLIPKRKRSLPHSPIRLPLGSVDSALSPSSPKSKDEFDVSLPVELAAKRKQDDANLGDDEGREARSIRRSGRTRLPVKAAPLAAPSFIPVRRLGQDGDNTVTLRRNEEKELAALTRVNTRKNKGGAQLPIQVLAKQAEEKEDPASRQRALKEVFDEKAQKQKRGKKGKTVVWAEELTQFQTEEGKMTELEREPEKEKEKAAPAEEKKTAVKVGVRSKMTLGMVVNGTPAPKRKMRGRS